MKGRNPTNWVALACGGTGGHLFPAVAVGEKLLERGWQVLLIVSKKAVDQAGSASLKGAEVASLSAVGLSAGRRWAFAIGLAKGCWEARGLFRRYRPAVVLAMGGYTSTPALWAGRAIGARCYLHEANSIPGRATKWSARWAHEVFGFFPEAAEGLPNRRLQPIGMPVRRPFQLLDQASCRIMLGLRPDDPCLLVTGGSQGARAINQAVLAALPRLIEAVPNLQVLHLTGSLDEERAQSAYREIPCHAVVRPFLTEMEYALGAATMAVTRAGASTLAELAATEVPALLIPYPHAPDGHQRSNAECFRRSGAVSVLEECHASPERLSEQIARLIRDDEARMRMREALRAWQTPEAADRMADAITAGINREGAEARESTVHALE